MIRQAIADLSALRRQLKENDEQQLHCESNSKWNTLQAQRIEILRDIKKKAEALAALAAAGIEIEAEIHTSQAIN